MDPMLASARENLRIAFVLLIIFCNVFLLIWYKGPSFVALLYDVARGRVDDEDSERIRSTHGRLFSDDKARTK